MTVQDVTGNGHDGSFTNTFHIGYTSAGYFGGGGAVLSDGASAQYVLVARSDDLEPASALTIMCWVNVPAALPNGDKIAVSKSRAGTADSYALYVRSSAHPTAEVVLSTPDAPGGLGFIELDSSTNIMNTGWHHLAATYDGTTAKIYVDAVLKNSTALTGDITYDASDLTLMGSQNYAPESTFGSLEDVRIYNTVLTIDEIAVCKDYPVRPFGVFTDPVAPDQLNTIDVQSTLGTAFRSDVDGYITAVYYFNGTSGLNGAAITAGIYDTSDQTLLGSGTRTQDVADPTGWVRVQLDVPVAIVADHLYIAAYLTPASGHYAALTLGLVTDQTAGGHITAPADDATGGAQRNGIFHQPSTVLTYPTSTFSASSYFVDVEFTPS